MALSTTLNGTRRRNNMTKAEFDGVRAQLYDEAMTEYPLARQHDIETMHRLLNLRPTTNVLGVGEGNGYFCKPITDVTTRARYTVTDPSQDQLATIQRRFSHLIDKPCTQRRLDLIAEGAEDLVSIGDNLYNRVWSFGAFHHCPNQTRGMQEINRVLLPGGKAVICDVFQGSPLARHFDTQVARYCVTGHDVKFLSEEFARTLTYLAGFDESKVQIVDLPQRWKFDSERDMGRFIYKLHAMTNLPGDEEEKFAQAAEGCKNILGITHQDGKVILNWPMKAIVAVKD